MVAAGMINPTNQRCCLDARTHRINMSCVTIGDPSLKENTIVVYGAGQFGSTLRGKRSVPVKRFRKHLERYVTVVLTSEMRTSRWVLQNLCYQRERILPFPLVGFKTSSIQVLGFRYLQLLASLNNLCDCKPENRVPPRESEFRQFLVMFCSWSVFCNPTTHATMSTPSTPKIYATWTTDETDALLAWLGVPDNYHSYCNGKKTKVYAAIAETLRTKTKEQEREDMRMREEREHRLMVERFEMEKQQAQERTLMLQLQLAQLQGKNPPGAPPHGV
jgi:hypothetical protein